MGATTTSASFVTAISGAVSSEPLAVFGEHVEFPRHVVVVTDEIRLVGVLGNHAERLLLAAAADHDRNARDRGRLVDRFFDFVVFAGEARAFPAKHRHDDLQGFLEFLEALREGAEPKPQRVVFLLEPPRTDPQRGSSARDVVEGRDRLREERRVPVGVARNQCRKAHCRGMLGQSREERIALEHGLVGLA